MTRQAQLMVVMLAALGVGLTVWMLTSIGADVPGFEVSAARPPEPAGIASAHERLETPEDSARAPVDARAVLEEKPHAPPADSEAPSHWAPGSIAGRIQTDAGAPLTDIEIVLERNGDAISSWTHRVRNAVVLNGAFGSKKAVSVRTDAQGRYRFENVDPGSYTVCLFDRAEKFGRHQPDWSRSSLVLHADEARENVDFVLEQSNAIAGRVLDPEGRSVENAMVSVRLVQRLSDPSITQHSEWVLPQPVRTGREGTFWLCGLARGEYVLHAEPAPSSSVEPSGHTLASFDSASIHTGTSSATIVLQRWASVSGIVRAPDGSAWAHAGVIARNAEGGQVGAAFADADGRFELRVPADMDIDLVACPSHPLGEGRNGWSMGVAAAGRPVRGVRAPNKAVVLVLERSQ